MNNTILLVTYTMRVVLIGATTLGLGAMGYWGMDAYQGGRLPRRDAMVDWARATSRLQMDWLRSMMPQLDVASWFSSTDCF